MRGRRRQRCLHLMLMGCILRQEAKNTVPSGANDARCWDVYPAHAADSAALQTTPSDRIMVISRG